MIELTEKEIDQMVSQNGLPSRSKFGGALPLAFTEQGVAMLSSVLRSKRAVEVNIAIMRTFVQVRKLLDSNRALEEKIKELESKHKGHDDQLRVVFEVLQELMATPEKPRRKIGFKD